MPRPFRKDCKTRLYDRHPDAQDKQATTQQLVLVPMDAPAQLSRDPLRDVRSTDTAARDGGDEFLIICTGNSYPPDVDSLADRLLAMEIPGNREGMNYEE